MDPSLQCVSRSGLMNRFERGVHATDLNRASQAAHYRVASMAASWGIAACECFHATHFSTGGHTAADDSGTIKRLTTMQSASPKPRMTGLGWQ